MKPLKNHGSDCSVSNWFIFTHQTTNKCLWCTEIDYIEHAFYQCTKLENFWRKVKQYILISYDWRFKINERVAIFGRNTSMANVKTLHWYSKWSWKWGATKYKLLSERVSYLVFYAQSTITVISGRLSERERERQTERETHTHTHTKRERGRERETERERTSN